MKIIAYLIITASLVAGTLSAGTAYVVDLSGVDASALGDLEGLRLRADAGRFDVNAPAVGPDGEWTLAERARAYRRSLEEASGSADDAEEAAGLEDPAVAAEPTAQEVVLERSAVSAIGRRDEVLSAELVGLLGEAGVRYVRVKSFDAGRWPHLWVFGLSALGLLVGALMVRRSAKEELRRAALAGGAAGSVAVAQAGPVESLRVLGEALSSLREDLASVADDAARNAMIADRVGAMQRDQVAAVIESRPGIVSERGLAGYADFMDAFAALERQLNRSWSAAVDGVYAEAAECLERAASLVPTASERLGLPA